MTLESRPGPILPGATLGLLGGGQLGRMTALAARSMGYRVVVLDPHADCAATPVADAVLVAAFDDAEAARELARRSAVVTYEIERIAPAVLQAVAETGLLRPGAEVLSCIQDRARQKRWLEDHQYPVGPWREVANEEELRQALSAFGPCRVKRTQGGYDGRSQVRVEGPGGAAQAMKELNGPSVAEQELRLRQELSVLVARSPLGQVVAHPPAANWHDDGVLGCSLFPAPVPRRLAKEATDLATSLAVALGLEGLLAVELFVTESDRLLVNELSPRPHNTFHAAGAACPTSQFEQFVRAICGLPLGSTEAQGASVLINLLGDLWLTSPPPMEAVLAVPGVSLHLYGKEPRPRRKVGHLTVCGASAAQALARAEAAVAHLDPALP
ncbi:5-(carboxyamino)imidazole ribonucleotide synthase [Geothrix sp. PMB-07]|uniref:5-(carboxyamino)imidazole ribonucleotide synthase n=1 Tax=Geothrix sp. PMB-07 TaxID=3068640 RepID=UPI002741A776|nr:5-(carboxyamino)imidazole ribonucleotide synthase [Geothrix sp. PMB-07]WLT32213.1 5-(carboxyamino)imidazole ribonucleotide synthase [Geothrix sp. PMB-07]